MHLFPLHLYFTHFMFLIGSVSRLYNKEYIMMMIIWIYHCLSVELKWHAWFASRCPGKHLSTWQMIAASCLTALSALCGRLTFRLALYHRHTAAMATELLQPLDLVCGTLTSPTAQSRHHLPTVSMTSEGTPFWEPWTRRSVTSDM